MSKPIPYSVEGLCAVLEIERQSLLNYAKKEEFFDTIKKAKEEILANQVEMAMVGSSNPMFTIFLLKNNQGYADKTETQITGDVRVEKIVREYK
ncbi:MAG: terminase small subunit, partial [Candidatus Thorarchaeota archaeon]